MEAKARGHRFLEASGSNNDGTLKKKECKATVFQVLYKWFKKMPFTNLNRKYLALREVVGKEALIDCMWRLFEDAISREE